MLRTRTFATPASALLVGLLAAGCGGADSTLERVAQFLLREGQRRRDAQTVRMDPILEASFRGNLPAVRRLLDADPESTRIHLQSRDPVGMTALHLATWGGHPEIVRLLLERGADVNAQDGGGQTPVSLAARWGRSDLMDIFLAHGADTSIRDDQGRTLLHYAAQYDHVEVMRALISRGFDVNVQAITGTPLHSAAFMGRLAAARLLLDHGADPERRGAYGWKPLHVACVSATREPINADLVRLLLDRGADVAARSDDGITPLVLASQNRDSAVVTLLLERGARPESAVPRGYSALRSAVDAKAPAIARLLLARGADPNQRYSPPGNQRLLSRTAQDGDLPTARVLLDFGADPGLADDRGLTPLHEAAREGHVEMIRLLLAHRAQVNARDRNRWTPLHFAASQKQVEAARALLAAGADRTALNTSRETPLKMAWGAGAESLRVLLAPTGSVPPTH